jgi:hypothetical protein
MSKIRRKLDFCIGKVKRRKRKEEQKNGQGK